MPTEIWRPLNSSSTTSTRNTTTFGERNPIERVFQEIKRRTSQFYNHFENASPEAVEDWLLAVGPKII
jgi:transposase-like protein